MYFLELIGTISFAISGFLISIRHKLDLLGIFLMAFVTALGGGIIRDTIANKFPTVFVDIIPSIVVLVSIFLAFILKLHQRLELDRKNMFVISDAIGLVSFAIVGASVGLYNDANLFGVIILAFITAVGGGMIRDILINHIPMVLKHDFYGTVVIIVAFVMYILKTNDILNFYTITIVFVFGVFLRMLAYKQKWKLPKF